VVEKVQILNQAIPTQMAQLVAREVVAVNLVQVPLELLTKVTLVVMALLVREAVVVAQVRQVKRLQLQIMAVMAALVLLLQ
jgi:hypothetical protein